MVGINDNAILDRIVENLVFPANDLIGDTASDPKLSKILFGDPPNDKPNAKAGNTAYVKQSKQPLVSSVRAGTTKTRKTKIETRQYEIVLITGTGGSLESKLRDINTLVFKTKEAIEKNIPLAKSDGTLPMAFDGEVFDVVRDASSLGQERQSHNVLIRYDLIISE